MSDKPKTATITAPTLEVKATGPAEKPRTPEQDAKDAKAERQASEDKAAAAHDELKKSGKLVEPTAIVGYETAREALGAPVEGVATGADADKE